MKSNRELAYELTKVMFGTKRDFKRSVNNMAWAMTNFKYDEGKAIEGSFLFEADPKFALLSEDVPVEQHHDIMMLALSMNAGWMPTFWANNMPNLK